MFHPTLEAILTPAFLADVGFRLPTGPMKRTLAGRPEVAALRSARRSGALSDSQIESFIEAVLKSFRPGEILDADTSLAALAVALCTESNAFVETMLNDLGALRIREMPLSPRIARACLASRANQPKLITNRFSFPLVFERATAGTFYAQGAPGNFVGGSREIFEWAT